MCFTLAVQLVKEAGERKRMSKSLQTLASLVAPSFNTYTSNPTWNAKRAYAHFATEAQGVNA
jgi:hypothetical protein